jgi:hypothetical protein
MLIIRPLTKAKCQSLVIDLDADWQRRVIRRAIKHKEILASSSREH